jgi:hypothetical protein
MQPNWPVSPNRNVLILAAVLLFSVSLAAQTADQKVQQFSDRFWNWRATEQPFTEDDIPRLDRPSGFVAHWSAADESGYEKQVTQLEEDWRAISVADAPIATQVDWRLLGSAIARVRWELEGVPDWKRSPRFYVDQGLGAVYAAVLVRPFTAVRRQEMLVRLASVPRLLAEGRVNLTDMRQPYAAISMEYLSGVEQRMQRFHDGIHADGGLSSTELTTFDTEEAAATKALVEYREWLRPQIATLPQETAVGRDGYIWFLRNVALLSYTPEQLLAIGDEEFQRAVAFEALQAAANTGLTPQSVYASAALQASEEAKQEKNLRAYMASHGILREPAEVKHYRYVPIPSYVKALGSV